MDERLERDLRSGLAAILDPIEGSHPRWATSPAARRVEGTAARRWPRLALDRRWAAALAALLVVCLVAAAAFFGWWHQQAGTTNPTPTPAPTVQATPVPSPAPTVAPRPIGLVVYTVIHCVPGGGSDLAGRQYVQTCTSTPWIAAGDGSGARVLPAGGTPLGWSADGSRLLVETGPGFLHLADATGSEVATIPVPLCAVTSLTGTEASDCTSQNDFALSPDGTRVAFVRSNANGDNSTVVAILDLNSGRSTELTATRTTNPPLPEVCNTGNKIRTCQGDDGNPRWSPDGRRIVFDRFWMSPEPGATWDSGALFVVDADGRNLRRVTPTGLEAVDPIWSPDGTRVAFTNNVMVVNAGRTSVLDTKHDVYTIRLDGTGLTRLTDDGISAPLSWTADGRLVFIREISPVGTGGNPSGREQWVMDADGGSPIRLGGSLAELTAAGCTTCLYAADSQASVAYWQPVP